MARVICKTCFGRGIILGTSCKMCNGSGFAGDFNDSRNKSVLAVDLPTNKQDDFSKLQEQHDKFVNKILQNSPEEWKTEEETEFVAIQYTRFLESKVKWLEEQFSYLVREEKMEELMELQTKVLKLEKAMRAIFYGLRKSGDYNRFAQAIQAELEELQ